VQFGASGVDLGPEVGKTHVVYHQSAVSGKRGVCSVAMSSIGASPKWLTDRATDIRKQRHRNSLSLNPLRAKKIIEWE
jgi:hypothetical protein